MHADQTSTVPARPHVQQQAAFQRLRHHFADRLAAVVGHAGEGLVRDDWQQRNRQLCDDLLPRPAPDFLRHPAILYQMFVGDRHLPTELPYVLDRLTSATIAAEDPIGDPPTTRLEDEAVTTSSNTVHHLHHLLRYEAETGRAVSDCDTVVEWGGGYGNLAKLFFRLHGGRPTYVLVDTPVFSAIQWLYLSAVLGEDLVRLHEGPAEPVERSVVNVVPVGVAASVDVDADLFISTWALNESTVASQDLVVARTWFGAESLLLGMHEGDPFAPVARAHGARSVPVADTLPAQRYFVR